MATNEIAERCVPFEEDLSAFLDGELDAGRHAEVASHLESCAACAARFGMLRAADATLRRVAERATDAEAARLERVRRGAEIALRAARAGERHAVPRTAPSRRSRWTPPLGAVAIAASAAGLYLLVRPPAEPLDSGAIEVVAQSEPPAPAATPPAAPANPPPAPAAPTAVASRAANDAFAGKGASASIEHDEAPALPLPEPPSLDAASDDELALAAELRELRVESKVDLEIVERLDLLERLDALDAVEPGRG